VDIVSFGSARPIAVAFNRAPKLMAQKVRMIHLCAGGAPKGFLEWNVKLDVHAFVRLLRSDLPISIYPCAPENGPFDRGPNNTYWSLPNLNFIHGMSQKLQRYIEYAFTRSSRMDFLGVLEEKQPLADMAPHYKHTHNVWETAIWMEVTGRRLVRRADGTHRIENPASLAEGHTVLAHALQSCTVEVDNDGQFDAQPTKGPSNFFLYERGDALLNETALRDALPRLYRQWLPIND
ncbi:MAG: hypothetical protein L3K26_09210, partial [Candidatus Hydrogenedentes bacterium]|nr:hypothetical protein [Candidatus Hydrogenedentota bacterium]